MKATPAMPSTRPAAPDQVMRSPSTKAATTAVDDRIGAEDENRQRGRNITQGDVTDAEVDGLVGNAQQSEQKNIPGNARR